MNIHLRHDLLVWSELWSPRSSALNSHTRLRSELAAFVGWTMLILPFVGMSPASAAASADPAVATAPSRFPAGCAGPVDLSKEIAGYYVVCTYLATGSEQTLTVPPFVNAIRVSAIGGHGGAANSFGDGQSGNGTGGAGGTVGGAAGDLFPVVPGQILYIEVGGNGANADGNTGTTPGGFNGGGSGNGLANSGGGGGASAVGLVSRDQGPSKKWLIVAGGGGGGGSGNLSYSGGIAFNAGGNGGAAGANGGTGNGTGSGITKLFGGGGGVAGGVAAGGTGGAIGSGDNTVSAAAGVSGSIGQGGNNVARDLGLGQRTYSGGGGGGGYFGGGGGGRGASTNGNTSGDGGGGGGSSMSSARLDGPTGVLWPNAAPFGTATNGVAASVVITLLVKGGPPCWSLSGCQPNWWDGPFIPISGVPGPARP
jgi:hypothetical protein